MVSRSADASPERPTVALFRAPDDAAASARRLNRLGFATVRLPAIRYRRLAPPSPLPRCDAIVATSASALALLPRETQARLDGLPLFVVGARTAEAAARAGLALAAPPAPEAAGLARTLIASLPQGARLLYLAGRDRKPLLEAALAPRFTLTALEVYAAEPVEAWSARDVRRLEACCAALHYSRRSAALAAALAAAAGRSAAFRALTHVCLSPDVAAGLVESRAGAIVCADSPNEAALFETLRRAIVNLH